MPFFSILVLVLSNGFDKRQSRRRKKHTKNEKAAQTMSFVESSCKSLLIYLVCS